MDTDSGSIFHIALVADWETARRIGQYTVSTRGVSLEREGFIHASFTREQVERVGRAAYVDAGALVVLEIDLARLAPPVRAESLHGGDELFPHIYGPVATTAVVRTIPARGHGEFVVEWPG